MTTFRSEAPAIIRIVAAVVVDEAGRVLLVRKRGTAAFMLPGGKPAPKESASEALARELVEELGCAPASAPIPLGRFCAPAANEPGHEVRAELFAATLDGTARARGEIDSLIWHDAACEPAFPLAPLARDHVLPLVRARRAAA